jgi:hypothetical protein
VEPIVDDREKRQRFLSMTLGYWSDYRHISSRLFHSHLRGLDAVKGRVLEIGGTDAINLEPYFRKKRAPINYTDVRLERDSRNSRNILSMDFMDIPDGAGKFDMIISMGVFEHGAIDIVQRSFQRLNKAWTEAERLEKLHGLLSEGGTCVIGTISDPCMFSSPKIMAAGFNLVHKKRQFYSFMTLYPELYSANDSSELLVMQKAG